MNDSRRNLEVERRQSAAKTAVVKPVKRSTAGDRPEPLSVCVERALEGYFERLDGEPAAGLYGMVLAEVEAPLLRTVMQHAGGNQCQAAAMLGLNRGTLRKKLKHYDLL